MSAVTVILSRAQRGDPKAAAELLPLVYEELRRVAAARMAGNAAGQTLQPTALVHEAWLRLVDKDGEAQLQNRTHFFAAAAEAMRHILIDRARRTARAAPASSPPAADFPSETHACFRPADPGHDGALPFAERIPEKTLTSGADGVRRTPRKQKFPAAALSAFLSASSSRQPHSHRNDWGDPFYPRISFVNTTKTMKSSIILLAALLVTLVSFQRVHSASPTFTDANWVSMGGLLGPDTGSLNATAVDPAGNLYIGGTFTKVNGLAAKGVARWDGTNWTALSSGNEFAYVSALACSGNNLYAAGGTNSQSGNTFVAKWDGHTWTRLGEFDGELRSLAVAGTTLYVGGWYLSVDGTSAASLASWNGISWSALGSGLASVDPMVVVNALAVSGGDLYVGGRFSTAGGIPANNIAKWDGNSWSALGSGTDGSNPGVNALAVMGTNVYAGGSFTFAGGSVANYFAKWDGSGWSTPGVGMDFYVLSLTASGTNLYAAGAFNTAGGTAAHRVAKWDGTSWSALGTDAGVREPITSLHALAAHGDTLYVGASSFGAGVPARGIARWNGNQWSALGQIGNQKFSVNGAVNALAAMGGDLYVGGGFLSAGTVAANCIAKWNGSSWSALGSGVEDPGAPGYSMFVSCLAVMGSDLYAGGFFKQAGGVTVNYIGKWDGTNWSALGSGLNDAPHAMVVSGTNLYVGGRFTMAGGQPAAHVAKWDGTSWSALDTGVDGWVLALAISGSNLYVGGYYGFEFAGGQPAKRIAKWNGTSWSGLGTQGWGDNSLVGALAASGDDLYVGGYITDSTGLTNTPFQKWNQNSGWTDLGLEGWVGALLFNGGDLYLGGSFTSVGGVAATNIARWNGSTGSALGGSGVDGGVAALALQGSDLWVGGGFNLAGGKISPNLARAYLVAPPGGIADSIATGTGTATIQFCGNPGHEFDVLRATNLVPPVVWTKLNVSPLSPGTNGLFTFTDSSAPNGNAYYRSVEK